MFGSLRFFFALAVIVTHIGSIEVFGGVAVWGFFMLSGFLMTAVLNTKYGFTSIGVATFFTSRFIRLYPGFWIVSIFSLALIAAFGSQIDPRAINTALVVPSEARDIIANFTILGHTTLGIGRISQSLVPPAWAVDVEILMYVLSAVYLAKSGKRAGIVAIILAVLFPVLWFLGKKFIAMGEIELGGQLIYSFLPAALLPYSIGSWIWFSRARLISSLGAGSVWPWICAAILLILVNALLISKFSVTGAYILSLPPLGVLLICLSVCKGRPWDDILGQMSYPIYLLHFPCAFLFVVMTSAAFPSQLYQFDPTDNHYHFTLLGFLGVTFLTLAFSFLMAVLIEKPLERVRHILPAKVWRLI